MLLQLSIFVIFCISNAFSDCPDSLKNMLNANMQDNLKNGCEADWKYFKRPAGGWCIKVFTGVKTFEDSKKSCESVNSTLSGLQNAQEVVFIQRATLASISQTSSSVFIGMKRTAKCIGEKLTSSCSKLTSFEWTDGSASGTDGFVFQEGRPENWKLNENCAVLFASVAPKVAASGGNFYAGTLDDVACDLPAVSTGPRAALAYVCGKKASK